MRTIISGLISLFLLTLSACSTPRHQSLMPQSAAPQCPPLNPCLMPKRKIASNGDLLLAMQETRQALAICAGQTDAANACMGRRHEQAAEPAPGDSGR